MKDYNYPVYGTQGGLCRFIGETGIFITKPDCPGFDVGDEVPQEWDMLPANDLACQEIARKDYYDMISNPLK
jgi:hypothetical protein